MTQPLLDTAREAFERCDWHTALDLFAEAAEAAPLDAEDLERVALATRWAGRFDEVFDAFERAHSAYVARDDALRAARMALALCQCNWDLGQSAVAAGWWRRASTLLEGVAESAEHGLLQWHRARSLADAGDVQGQQQAATAAYEIGRRVGDRTVEALGLADRGHAEVAAGRIAEGLPLLDEAAAHAMSGELDPMATGQIYCSVIWVCRSRGDWKRAREWTDTVQRWCHRERRAYFPGLCRTHRAEVLRMHGELEAAEATVTTAIEDLLTSSPRIAGIAYGELGEIRRRRGDLEGAQEAFRRSIELGWEPQPGLARLMLARGDPHAAHRSLERAMVGSSWIQEEAAPMHATRASAAIAVGDLPTAEAAVEDLEALVAQTESAADIGAAASAAAELALASGDVSAAVNHLLRSRQAWIGLQAPFETGATRVLLARALREEGDTAGALLELDAAIAAFTQIGARFEQRRATDLRESLRQAGASAAPAPTQPPPEAGPKEGVGVFRKEGDYWMVTYAGKSLRLKDSRGTGYVAALLAAPGLEVLCADLAADRIPAPAERSQDTPGSARDLSDAAERIDDKARGDYRRRLLELREELDDAEALQHLDRAEKLREEMDFLARELSAAVGLGGKARRFSSPAERARQSVTKAIRKTISRIANDHPSLGRLLETTIKTGTFCRYDPDPRIPVTWEL